MTTGASSAQAVITLPTTPNGFQITGANATLSNMGFIVSFCIIHQCVVYRHQSIIQFNIRRNYNITEIPAEAFVGATNIGVSQNNIYEIIQSLRADPANETICGHMFYFIHAFDKFRSWRSWRMSLFVSKTDIPKHQNTIAINLLKFCVAQLDRSTEPLLNRIKSTLFKNCSIFPGIPMLWKPTALYPQFGF